MRKAEGGKKDEEHRQGGDWETCRWGVREMRGAV